MESKSRSANDCGTVVVIDDDVAVRNSLKFTLEVEGFTVRIFADGQELLDDKPLTPSDCLVVDQNLPRMRGLELIAELRRRNNKVPAILITTNPSDAVRRQASAAGVPIVEKPLLNSLLFDAIRRAMPNPPPVN
ncbi:MAG: response regulator [Alphaproteobacteria bacterium]|nr:response regulator [Alphaproteobacteria bacterium]